VTPRGSHPILVDEFVRSVVDGRPPLIDARRGAALPGICAHASAMAGGATVGVADHAAWPPGRFTR
jgi:hypothetical protein